MHRPSVYFYCCADEGNLQEDVISLAEGLRELQVPFFANCDYWLQSEDPKDYLFRASQDVTPDDCDIVVVSYTWPFWTRMGSFDVIRRPLPMGLFRRGHPYTTVYMDNHDGHRTISWEAEFRNFDLILRSKLNRRAWHPENVKPWALGFTQRIITATAGAPAFAQRSPHVLINFGASHGYAHGAREMAHVCFEPHIDGIFSIDRTKDDLSVEPPNSYEALMWRQTGGRFSTSYYERLKRSQAVACFCGELIPPMPFKNPECYLVGGTKAKIRRLLYEAISRLDRRPRRTVQWDSFRFWEALCAGCLVFNLDLHYYGAELPVMPENWKHYIGLRLDKRDNSLDRLIAEWHRLPDIADAGHQWALLNYSPKAMAARFLKYCGFGNLESFSQAAIQMSASSAT